MATHAVRGGRGAGMGPWADREGVMMKSTCSNNATCRHDGTVCPGTSSILTLHIA